MILNLNLLRGKKKSLACSNPPGGTRDTAEPESTAANKYASKPLGRDIKPLFIYKLQTLGLACD